MKRVIEKISIIVLLLHLVVIPPLIVLVNRETNHLAVEIENRDQKDYRWESRIKKRVITIKICNDVILIGSISSSSIGIAWLGFSLWSQRCKRRKSSEADFNIG